MPYHLQKKRLIEDFGTLKIETKFVVEDPAPNVIHSPVESPLESNDEIISYPSEEM